MTNPSYYIDGLLRQASAQQARDYLQSNVVPNLTADPAGPVTGQIYFNSTTGKFRGWNGTAWVDLN